MNNSLMESEGESEIIDTTPQIQREAKLAKVIEAIKEVGANEGWKVLSREIFAPLVENLERRISQEAKKKPIVESEIYSLQGQLQWATRYSNLEKYSEELKAELQNLKQQTNAKRNQESEY